MARLPRAMEVMTSAIRLHDTENRILVERDMRPLLGRYLTYLWEDPWGRPYEYDAASGMVISRGPDGVPSSDDVTKSTAGRWVATVERVASKTGWLGTELSLGGPGTMKRYHPRVVIPAAVAGTSWTRVNELLAAGVRPEAPWTRVEEFVNAFHYGALDEVEPGCRLRVESAASPYDGGRLMAMVCLRWCDVSPTPHRRRNLTIVFDAPADSTMPWGLFFMRRALHAVLDGLDAGDRVAIVSTDSARRVVLSMTSLSDGKDMHAAVAGLRTSVHEEFSAALEKAFDMARNARASAEESDVLFCSSRIPGWPGSKGRLNDCPKELVRGGRDEGFAVTLAGFGSGQWGDEIDRMARKCDGRAVWVTDMTAATVKLPAAVVRKDLFHGGNVNIGIEVDKRVVRSWRLCGYEPFDDLFHSGSYRTSPFGAPLQRLALIIELEPAADVRREEFRCWSAGRIVVRTASNDRQQPSEQHFDIPMTSPSSAPSLDYRVAVLAVQLAELLRRSPHAVGLTPTTLHERARALLLAAPRDSRCIELERIAGLVVVASERAGAD